jgi:heme-degrading monooxygenase HmoA
VIARIWRGETEPSQADRYLDHLRERTFPGLKEIPGHRLAYALRRANGARVEFLVITLWDSLDAIRAFAGSDAEVAVVPPEARVLLTSHDPRAVHWEVALDNNQTRGAK